MAARGAPTNREASCCRVQNHLGAEPTQICDGSRPDRGSDGGDTAPHGRLACSHHGPGHDPVGLGPPRRRDLPGRGHDGRRRDRRAARRVRVGQPRRARHRRSGGLAARAPRAVRRWEAAAAMAVLGVTEHHVLGLPDGALADHAAAGIALGRAAARRGAAGHDPDVRPRRDDLPPRPHRRAPLGHRGLGAAGPPGRLLYATPTVEHLARFGELYEEWDMYMSDERPDRRPGRRARPCTSASTGRRSTARWPRCASMATQTSEAVASLGVEPYAEQNAEETFVTRPVPGRPPSPTSPVGRRYRHDGGPARGGSEWTPPTTRTGSRAVR